MMNSTSGAPAASRRLEVVVVFTDIVDFTSYCDTHGEEAGLALVTRHENLVTPIVNINGGTFVKTIGDATMAYFMEPERAALAAQEIMKAVEKTNAGQPSNGQMNLRAALNVGPVIIRDSDLFGDAVNVASRMKDVGKPNQILISQTMIDALGDNPKFMCRFVGMADFHGKTGPLKVYELLSKLLELGEKTKARIVSNRMSETAAELAPAAEKKQELLGGKYFIERMIGEGAYGKVYKARNAQDGQAVAIKILPEDAYIFYSREAQILRQLQPFPYVMEIYDAFVDPQGLCIVMPYIEHGSVQTYMNKLHGDPLEPGQIVLLMEQLLSAIAHAHKKEVIHRDIKPQNILLRGGMDSLLTDFGVAHAVESTGRGTTQTTGTSGYIAPEVVSGQFDSTIDIYSAGVVMYRMLGGQFPLDVATLPPSTFPDFKKVVERATAPRSKRYSRAGEMLADIEKAGSKIIAPTIQNIALAGEERILLAVTEESRKLIEPALAAMKVLTMHCAAADIINRVHWHAPAVTILDFDTLAGWNLDISTALRACVALGTRIIIVNCPGESEAAAMIKLGAADCLPLLQIPGVIDNLTASIDTLMTKVQMGGGSWWKRMLG